MKKILCLLIVGVFCFSVLASCNTNKGDEGESQTSSDVVVDDTSAETQLDTDKDEESDVESEENTDADTDADTAGDTTGGDESDVIDDTETDTEVDELPINELPNTTYNGYNYRILARESYYKADFEADSNTKDTVGRQVYARNLFVQNKYGVTISTDYFAEKGRDKGNFSDDKVQTTLATGQDVYSLVATHGRYATGYAINNACLDWNDDTEFGYFNLEHDWWSQGARECFTINDRLYFMVGDLCHMSAASSYCVMANINALDAAGIEVPYEDVKEGTWTFDKMARYAKLAAKDDGNGKWEIGVDTMGYVTQFWGGTYCAFFASGGRIVQEDSNGNLYISIYDNGEATDTVLQNFFDLVNSNEGYQGDINFTTLIQSETYVFMDIVLDNIADKVKSVQGDIRYAILPYPKTAEDVDSYVSHTAGEYDVVLIPKTLKDESREAVCVVTEALCQKGSTDVVPVYYDTVVCGRTLQQANDIEMIKIIQDSRIYDFGYYYSNIDTGTGGTGISNLLWRLGSDNAKDGEGASSFGAYYTSAISIAEENLKKLQDAFSK